jgi:hypothetical protein
MDSQLRTDLQAVILRGLLQDIDYARQFLPWLKESYFDSISVSERQDPDNDNDIPAGKLVFRAIKQYIDKYDGCPSKEQLLIDLDSGGGPKVEANRIIALKLDEIAGPEVGREWLRDQTQDFIADKHCHDQVMGICKALTHGKPHATFAEALLYPPSFENTLKGIYSKDPCFLDDLREQNSKTDTSIPFDIQSRFRCEVSGPSYW